MKKQRGVALSSLMFWGILFALATMLTFKVAPEVVDFYKIKRIVKATATNASGKTVPEIRGIYSKYAEVDHIKTVDSGDIDISKDGNEVVISFAYDKQIPLFANVSLLINFQGSSSERDKSE